jgi:hypothetical protein
MPVFLTYKIAKQLFGSNIPKSIRNSMACVYFQYLCFSLVSENYDIEIAQSMNFASITLGKV